VRQRLPQIGTITVATGLLATILAIAAFGVHTIGVALIATMFVMNLGMGLAVPTLIHLAVRDVPSSEAGTAAGMFSTAQQVGNGLGIAIVGTIFFSALGGRSGPIAYGQAFSLAMGVQLGLVLLSTAILLRASIRRATVRTRPAELAPASAAARLR
jgi:predicted MFS family arabinose efflux permease